jgi:hypothetical protein
LSAAQRGNTDPILLAELMATRALILNLFAAASKGPLMDESLRKMQAYADSVKQQKADEFLTKLRAGSGANRHRVRHETARFLRSFPVVDRGCTSGNLRFSAIAIGCVAGMGDATARTVLSAQLP